MRIAVMLSCCLLWSCTVGEPGDDLQAGEGLDEANLDEGAEDTDLLAARVCASGATTKGIDVSYYQGVINWNAVKNAGYEFAFIRVSDGNMRADPRFAANWAGAKQAGVLRGAYQFFRPSQDVAAQANRMISAIGTLQPGDLPPVIDVETTSGLSPSAVASRVRQWVDRVAAATGRTPIVYTGKYFWRDQVGAPASFKENPLWIAQYTSLCPDLPPPWSTWAFWQYSDRGSVPGISGAVDVNRFNGSLAELRAFANASSAPTGSGSSCMSETMNKELPAGTCVRSGADMGWFLCSEGLWYRQTSTAACGAMYDWCNSATLGRDVPPRTCVQAASDGLWYQCSGQGWVTGVNTSTQSGPAGACVQFYPL